jgi:hypothetical protein
MRYAPRAHAHGVAFCWPPVPTQAFSLRLVRARRASAGGRPSGHPSSILEHRVTTTFSPRRHHCCQGMMHKTAAYCDISLRHRNLVANGMQQTSISRMAQGCVEHFAKPIAVWQRIRINHHSRPWDCDPPLWPPGWRIALEPVISARALLRSSRPRVALIRWALIRPRAELRPTGNARMPPMPDLPVVPKCRTHLALRRRANHNDALAHPASARGALRPIVTKREAGCGGRGSVGRGDIAGRVQARERFNRARKTTGVVAYGEVVWSWHPLLMSSWRRSIGPTGYGSIVNSPTTVAKRNSSPGRSRISR